MHKALHTRTMTSPSRRSPPLSPSADWSRSRSVSPSKSRSRSRPPQHVERKEWMEKTAARLELAAEVAEKHGGERKGGFEAAVPSQTKRALAGSAKPANFNAAEPSVQPGIHGGPRLRDALRGKLAAAPLDRRWPQNRAGGEWTGGDSVQSEQARRDDQWTPGHGSRREWKYLHH